MHSQPLQSLRNAILLLCLRRYLFLSTQHLRIMRSKIRNVNCSWVFLETTNHIWHTFQLVCFTNVTEMTLKVQSCVGSANAIAMKLFVRVRSCTNDAGLLYFIMNFFAIKSGIHTATSDLCALLWINTLFCLFSRVTTCFSDAF